MFVCNVLLPICINEPEYSIRENELFWINNAQYKHVIAYALRDIYLSSKELKYALLHPLAEDCLKPDLSVTEDHIEYLIFRVKLSMLL